MYEVSHTNRCWVNAYITRGYLNATGLIMSHREVCTDKVTFPLSQSVAPECSNHLLLPPSSSCSSHVAVFILTDNNNNNNNFFTYLKLKD